MALAYEDETVVDGESHVHPIHVLSEMETYIMQTFRTLLGRASS